MQRTLQRLSATAIKNARKPGYLNDGGGLYLQVATGGTKSWIFRYQLNGRPHMMGLGAVATFTLAEARDRARHCRQLLADGVDPLSEKRAARAQSTAVLTFGQCAERYIEAHRAGWKNAKHAAQWDATLRTHCALLWPMPAGAIDTAAVMRCLEPIWQNRTETASRVRSRIENVLDWATVRGYRSGENPARWRGHLGQLLPARSKVQRIVHHAALPYAEIPPFMAQLRQRDSTAARVLELQILTATRPGEAAGAQWREFDLKAALWIIPPDRMKAGKEHRVPLSPRVVELLATLPQVNANIFPGVKDRAITTAAAMKLLKELRPGLTAHGFRSSFRDWAAETTSHPREVIEHAMAHRLKDHAEAAYARGDLLQRRAVLMRAWSDYCASVG